MKREASKIDIEFDNIMDCLDCCWDEVSEELVDKYWHKHSEKRQYVIRRLLGVNDLADTDEMCAALREVFRF